MSADNTPIEDDLPEQLRIRREKRAGLIERGIEENFVLQLFAKVMELNFKQCFH